MKSKKQNTKDADLFLEILMHFHPDSQSYGGWKINLGVKYSKSLQAKIEKEFPKMFKVSNDASRGVAEIERIPGASFSDKQTIQILKYELSFYLDHLDSIHTKVKELSNYV